MGDIVNLRRARKTRARVKDEEKARENRQRFGPSKAERDLAEKSQSLAERRLEGHRLGEAPPERRAKKWMPVFRENAAKTKESGAGFEFDRTAINSRRRRVMRRAPSQVRKHSLVIAGHSTSVSLETAFWDALREWAQEREMSVAAVVAEVDAARGEANLSSALRVRLLEFYREKASPL